MILKVTSEVFYRDLQLQCSFKHNPHNKNDDKNKCHQVLSLRYQLKVAEYTKNAFIRLTLTYINIITHTST